MPIDPTTGETLVGSTGLNHVGARAFTPVPEPGTFALLGVGLIGACIAAKRRASRA